MIESNSIPDRAASGFTLLELLVVIAAMSILISLLFPIVTSGIERANRTHCASSMKTLHVGIEMFMNDHEDRLPGANDPGNTQTRGLWYGQNMRNVSNKMHLLANLKPYLAEFTTNGQVTRGTFCRANVKKQLGNGSPVYITNHRVYFENGSHVDPWGYRNGPLPSYRHKIQGGTSESSWILEDIDQALPHANPSAGWYSQLPPNTVHGAYNRIFFDGHLESFR